MKSLGQLFLYVVALPVLAAEVTVPKEYVGEWAPKEISCQSPVRLRVEAKAVSLVNGSDSESFGNLDLCYSCEGGARYSGEVVWLVPEFGRGRSPFTVRFNANEEKGITTIEFEESELKKRFPLHNIRMRKCTNASLAGTYSDIPVVAKEFSCSPEKLFEGDTLVIEMSVPHPLELGVRGPDNNFFYVYQQQPNQAAEDALKFARISQLKLPTLTASAPSLGTPHGYRERIFQQDGWYTVYLSRTLETESLKSIVNQCRVYYSSKKSNKGT